MDYENQRKKQVNPFYCNICKIWCSSALNLQTHFLGAKHKTIEEALKAHGMLETETSLEKEEKTPAKPPDFVPPDTEKFCGPEMLNGQTLEDKLNTCKDSEPALGLNYVIEYRTEDNIPFLYECQLCNCKTGLSSMFMHVCGSRHRLEYLVVRGVPTVRRKLPKFFSEEDSPSKAKVQLVDAPFSEQTDAEQTDNKDEKLTDPTQDENDVQEENEERQKEQAKPDEKVEPNNAVESSEDNNSERCETNKELEEENKEAQQEFTANPEEFSSQEELLDYLQSFEILNEDDASFILKVTQTLTSALVEYRQQAASNGGCLDAEYNGETALEYSTEQPGPTPADITDSGTDYSSSQSAKQFLPANEAEPQDFSTGSWEVAFENNITTEFLNSVRNMNAEEIAATLHKIAASNPAFRGIDIPNVIRILTESGTLKGPSNGSTQ
ncbi:uncharacterized protein LOC134551022 isoform X2 [Prinia subflava]|uniref:uncharacterized protein LOC134551022 isoform X2 n=1 Tax=Prinia subflava TaxID=208062 RepID=UPI002FE02F23